MKVNTSNYYTLDINAFYDKRYIKYVIVPQTLLLSVMLLLLLQNKSTMQFWFVFIVRDSIPGFNTTQPQPHVQQCWIRFGILTSQAEPCLPAFDLLLLAQHLYNACVIQGFNHRSRPHKILPQRKEITFLALFKRVKPLMFWATVTVMQFTMYSIYIAVQESYLNRKLIPVKYVT